jgi:hypothetical protein
MDTASCLSVGGQPSVKQTLVEGRFFDSSETEVAGLWTQDHQFRRAQLNFPDTDCRATSRADRWAGSHDSLLS